jgi:hypothetical protein
MSPVNMTRATGGQEETLVTGRSWRSTMLVAGMDFTSGDNEILLRA